MGMRSRMLAVAGLVVVLAVGTAGAFAAEMGMMAATQMKTAITHARFAQQYDGIKTVKEHLQHVVNCIEGPKGGMFKAMGGNPCQGQGNGLLADARGAGGKYAGAVPWIEMANDIAAAGLKSATLGKTKAAGWAAQQTLEHAEKAMMMGK